MIRKSILALSLVAVSLGSVASTAASASLKPHKTVTVTFKGKITCKVNKTSTIKIKPGMSFGTKKTVTLTLTTNLYGCTGTTSQGGAKILSGTGVGKVTASLDCYLLATAPLPSQKGTIVWKTKGNAAAKTNVSLTKGSLKGSTVKYDSKQTGSFAGSGTVTVTVKESSTVLLDACNSKAGLTTINLSSGKFVS